MHKFTGAIGEETDEAHGDAEEVEDWPSIRKERPKPLDEHVELQHSRM
jgi:hypothetical protein